MKMTYPFSDYGAVLRLTRAVAESVDGTTVDDAASSLGLNPQTGNFKYQILAGRLLGFIIRQGNNLTVTGLGRRFIAPDRSRSDVEAALARVPAFSKLPIDETPDLTDQAITASLLEAEVPKARTSKTMRFYKDLVSGDDASDVARGSRRGKSRTLVLPDIVTTGKADSVAAVGPAAAFEDSTPIEVDPIRATAVPEGSAGPFRLIEDDALLALLAKAPEDKAGWPEARRENFIACVDALIRELLWTDR